MMGGHQYILSTVFSPMFPFPLWSRRGTPIYHLQSTPPCSHLLYDQGGGHQYISTIYSPMFPFPLRTRRGTPIFRFRPNVSTCHDSHLDLRQYSQHLPGGAEEDRGWGGSRRRELNRGGGGGLES